MGGMGKCKKDETLTISRKQKYNFNIEIVGKYLNNTLKFKFLRRVIAAEGVNRVSITEQM